MSGGSNHDRQLMARLVAVAVLSMWLLLAASSLLLLAVAWPDWLGVLLAAALAWFVFASRPRFDGLPPGVDLAPAEAPHLFALLERLAREMDAPLPDSILITSDFNAFARMSPWRRRRVVGFGWPAWVALDRDQRVAVLAHELAHLHSDVERSIPLQLSMATLYRWHETLKPAPWQTLGARTGLAAVIGWLYGVQARSYLRASQPAEISANRRAAEVVGSRTVISALETMTLGEVATGAMSRARMQRTDLWEGVSEAFDRLDPRRRQSIATEAVRVGGHVLSTHPPLGMVLSDLAKLGSSASFEVADEDWKALETEFRTHAGKLWRSDQP
ncbi:MAG: M48 family metallopeptidase [Acidimicrobiales bacterium]